MKIVAFLLVAAFHAAVCSAQRSDFDSEVHPEAPDYSLESNWVAMPFRNDAADVLPKGEAWVSDSSKQVDVFYVHPTVYQKGPLWNADLNMRKVNRRVERYPVRLQASVFNASCRVFAPRYRQAVVKVFYQNSEDGGKALDLAYGDVKRAFEHYLEYYNHGRPFIIAGHSQGTYHTRRLVREMIDTTTLRGQMVAAYIIGFQVNESMYSNLKFCADAEQTGCLVSWMSYAEGYQPEGEWFKNTQSINPLSWTMDTGLVVVNPHAGAVVLNTRRSSTKPMEARITNVGGNVLWVKTKAPWFRIMKNLHVADYGLFYMDIRENVRLRVEKYFERQKTNQLKQ